MKNCRLLVCLCALSTACSAPPSQGHEKNTVTQVPANLSVRVEPGAADKRQAMEGRIVFTWAGAPDRPDVYEGADYPDPHRAALHFNVANRGHRDISALKGRLQFTNAFGELIYSTRFESDESISAGESARETFVVNTLGDLDAEALYAANIDKVSIKLVPDQILFVDGGAWNAVDGMTNTPLPVSRDSVTLIATFLTYEMVATAQCGADLAGAHRDQARGNGKAAAKKVADAKQKFESLTSQYNLAKASAIGRPDLATGIDNVYESAHQFCLTPVADSTLSWDEWVAAFEGANATHRQIAGRLSALIRFESP